CCFCRKGSWAGWPLSSAGGSGEMPEHDAGSETGDVGKGERPRECGASRTQRPSGWLWVKSWCGEEAFRGSSGDRACNEAIWRPGGHLRRVLLCERKRNRLHRGPQRG